MAEILNALDMMYKWEAEKPSAVYMMQPHNGGQYETYTWKRVGEEVRRMANYLKQMNLPPKSHIGIVSKNCAHWIMSDLAIMMSGHVSIPLYPNLTAGTVQQIMNHCDAKVLFVGKLDTWAAMKEGVPGDVHGITFPFYGEEGQGYDSWDEIMKNTEPIEESPRRSNDDLMTIIYTSGTTGKPKGVMHTFHSFAFAATHAVDALNADFDIRFFSYLPLAHVAERLLVQFGSFYFGGQVNFAESLDTFAKNLAECKPTIFLGVPRIWTKFQQGIFSKMPESRLNTLLKIPFVSGMIRKKILAGLGLDEVKVAITGAAPTPVALLEWYKSKLGLVITEAYGMTENTAYSHFNRRDAYKFGTVGQVQPHVQVRISKENDEILVKSEAMMSGYYREPELSAAQFDDGFLKTGDQGEVDSEGYLKITGRVKDIFKTEKGKYVAPSPIEMDMSRNSFIEQVCLVGTTLPQPVALVVLSEEGRRHSNDAIEASLEETLNILNPDLDKHEHVKKVIIVNEEWTPENELLTPTLKIKRNAIEKKYGGFFLDWYAEKPVVVWESKG